VAGCGHFPFGSKMLQPHQYRSNWKGKENADITLCTMWTRGVYAKGLEFRLEHVLNERERTQEKKAIL